VDSAISQPSFELLEQLLLIRHFEELLLDQFQKGKVGGTTHTCLGQEYIPAAIMPLLRPEDWVFSNHRGHGHYLARFDDPQGLLAEIMGRAGGVCQGVGGSQHIKRDRYLSTGVQGESLPVAVGVALQLKRERAGAIAMPFIGDGTWGQGAVYEGLNMASLWRVPLCVVVENNHIAQTTDRTDNMAGTIEARVRAFGIGFHRCIGNDVAALQREIAPLITRVRETMLPLVIEFDTARLGSHSKGDDTRDPAHVATLRAADWRARYASAFPELFARADESARARVQAALSKVETAPPSTWTR
jgi:pyruvate dehydrogenase E1 component alpha subunit